jgi:phosphoribosylanthranilate isomerase
MKIKICGMKYPDNILDVASYHPDYMGFIFYPESSRYVGTGLEHILPELPSSVQKVGVFVNAPIKDVIRLSTLHDIQTVQLHGNEPPEYCENLKLLDFSVIKAFGVDTQFDFSILTEYQDYCDNFLFDTKTAQHGGSGQKFDWKLLKQYNNFKPVFLSGGLELSDIPSIHDLLKDVNIHALDFNSKLEVEPGRKDARQCRAAIERVHEL